MQLTASNVRIIAVVLTALCAVSGGIYLVFCKRKDYRRAFTYKGTAGLCFVVLGLLGTDANIRSLLGVGGAAPAGAWLVAAGLIFGLLGDQLLALRFICVNKKTQFFAAGAASFAVGHVLYIIALSHRAPGILLGGGQLPLLCKMRKLVYAVKLFLCHALPSSSIVPSSSSVSSKAGMNLSRKYFTSGSGLASSMARVCFSAEMNSSLPALRSSMHLM